METPEFIKKIDWSELRNQKKILIDTICKIHENEGDTIQADALEGILSLIDTIQDYAVDTAQIVRDIDVYDFEIEEARDEETQQTRMVLVCTNCGSENVQTKYWVNPNTKELFDLISYDQDDCWCENCQGHHKLKLKEV